MVVYLFWRRKLGPRGSSGNSRGPDTEVVWNGFSLGRKTPSGALLGDRPARGMWPPCPLGALHPPPGLPFRGSEPLVLWPGAPGPAPRTFPLPSPFPPPLTASSGWAPTGVMATGTAQILPTHMPHPGPSLELSASSRSGPPASLLIFTFTVCLCEENKPTKKRQR